MVGVVPVPAKKRWQPLIHRIGYCHCGYPVFFRNYLCLHCDRALGYEPEQARMLSLEPTAEDEDTWEIAGAKSGGPRYWRCANFGLAPQCNWLVPAEQVLPPEEGQPVATNQPQKLCRCCRLNRTVPDPEVGNNAARWCTVEVAKRRLVSSLIALGLPVASLIGEDIAQGLAFDLLSDDGPTPITTGHKDGVITINLREADDAAREAIRSALHEPYRTVLGHVRHESGHYYWSRLLENSPWLERFRALFGDERQDYTAALQKHYSEGPDPDWAENCVSAYASAHPWEDWAETWAHYLHMVDTLDTAIGSGMDSDHVDLLKDPFDHEVLYRLEDQEDEDDHAFLSFFNAWAGLTSVLNEFSLGMGIPDFYPFVLSKRSITKLHFVHRFLQAYRPVPAEPDPTDSTA